MNKIITAGCMAVATFAAVAVPTKTELERARPVVENMTKADLAAYKAGEKTAQKVAAAHIAYAQKAEGEAEKYLLLQGAFKLYARCGEYDLAADTIQIMKREIKDLPPEVIVEIVSDELRYVSDDKAPRLVAMLKEAKAMTRGDGALKDKSIKNRTSIQSIIDGMIKVPGRDYWLSETELTQGQWEAVMGYNLSAHKGANLPVENVSRDDCDVFFEKLNQTKEVRSSQFEFCLPDLGEWKYAAWAGSAGNGSWIKPGVIGDVCDMSWVRGNSSNQTHEVAMKSPNAFGFYDMFGNVWEWLAGDAPGGRGHVKGCHFRQKDDCCNWNAGVCLPKTHRNEEVGLRVAAHIRSNKAMNTLRLRLGGRLQAHRQDEKKIVRQQATVDGYTWSYRVDNDEATIEAKKDGRFCCAVTPAPKGRFTIPAVIDGAEVRHLGKHSFMGSAMSDVCIPEGVKTIGHGAFSWISGLRTVTLPSTVTEIGALPFISSDAMERFSVAQANLHFSSRNGMLCTKDGTVLISGVNGKVTIPDGVSTIKSNAFHRCGRLEAVTIPSSVTNINWGAFFCTGLKSVTMLGERPDAAQNAFKGCDKLLALHVPANAKSWAGMKEWQGKKLVFDAKEK